MSQWCSECKHVNKDDDFYTPSSGMMGIAIFGFPMPNPNYGKLKCENHKSIYYGCTMGACDKCDKFEPKY